MILRFCSVYGIQRSTMIACGFLGNLGKRSTTTLRGGAGKRLPEIVITLRHCTGGG